MKTIHILWLKIRRELCLIQGDLWGAVECNIDIEKIKKP
jgi:hypothetical protein